MNNDHALKFVSRWSVVTALVPLLLAVTFFGGVGFADSDSQLGPVYVELLQATRAPGLYRLAMLFDAVGWLAIGASLIGLAFLLRGHAPLRTRLIYAAAICQISGVLGGFLRMDGISHIALAYSSQAAAEQASSLLAFEQLNNLINAFFHAGNLLQGLGFILAASAVLSLPGFPRWLAIWLFVPGLLPLAQFVYVALIQSFSMPILMAHIFLGIIGVHSAMAISLWRPSETLRASAAGGLS